MAGGKIVKISLGLKLEFWYLLFSAAVFLVLAMAAGIIQPFLYGRGPGNMPPGPVYRGSAAKPQVAFACNVVWGEEYLPSMLETLDRNGIKATFFVGGSWADKHPALLAEIARRGHELGNHSYTHPHPNALSLEENKRQILQTERLIEELTGIRTRLYAPPYGEFNATVLSAAAELGYVTILWSIDTIDWQRPSEELLISRVMRKLHNGAIILMHPTAPTARALPELIQKIRNAGYSFGTVTEILDPAVSNRQ